MGDRRSSEWSALGLEPVEAMPRGVVREDAGASPFRSAEVPVLARFAAASLRERWKLHVEGASDVRAYVIEAALTESHLYVRHRVGSARVPRTALITRWREGSAACYGLVDGSALAFPAREADPLTSALDAELGARPDAPLRSKGTRHTRASTALASSTVGLAVALGDSLAAVGAWVLVLSFAAAWLAQNRVLVTREGLTLRTGTYPTWTRFVPREAIHAVIIRPREPMMASVITIELEVLNAKNVPKHYVVYRAATKEPARPYAEREVAPEAERVARLLGLPAPRWV